MPVHKYGTNKHMNSTKKSFIRGAAILGATGFLVKLIGVLYRIPLNNILGSGGAGIYFKAYPIYTYLLTLSTAGLPPTIAKLVAEKAAVGDHAGAKKIFKISVITSYSIHYTKLYEHRQTERLPCHR